MAVAQNPKIGIGENYFSKKESIIFENIPLGKWNGIFTILPRNFHRKAKFVSRGPKRNQNKKCSKNSLPKILLWTPRLWFHKPAENRSPKIYTCCSKYGNAPEKIIFFKKNKFFSKLFLWSGKNRFLKPGQATFRSLTEIQNLSLQSLVKNVKINIVSER